MVSEQQTAELIISLLEDNIQDPLGRDKKWIYDDTPRLDISSYPRISVTPLNTNYETQGMGSYSQLEDQTIVVEVYVDKNSKINVSNGSEEERAEQVADYLHRKIQTVIRANAQYFCDNGLLSVTPTDFNKSVNGKLIVFRDTFLAQVINE